MPTVIDPNMRMYVTALARDIDTLNASSANFLETIGKFGSSGNKSWTLFARAASGSFWWRLQARFRVISNAAEIWTLRQKKATEETLKSIDRLVELDIGFKRTEKGVMRLDTALQGIEKAKLAGIDVGYLYDAIEKMDDVGTIFTGMIKEVGGDKAEALTDTISLYTNIFGQYQVAQEKLDKGFWDYYKEKGIEKATEIGEFIMGDPSQIDPSKLSGIMGDLQSGNLRDVLGKSTDFLGDFWQTDDIFDTAMNKMKDFITFDLSNLKGISGDLLAQNFGDAGDKAKDFLGSFGGEFTETIKDQGRMVAGITKNFGTTIGNKLMPGLGITARDDWDTKSKLGGFQEKIGKKMGDFFNTPKLGKKLAGFAAMGIKVFASAFLYGAAVLLGLLFFIAIIKKAVPKILKVWEILGIAKMFFFSVGQILSGIFMILKGLWEGDILMVLEGLFRFLILGIGGALLTIGLTIVSAIITIVPIILISIGEAIIDMGILLFQRIKDGLGLAGGGTTTGGINLVGERGPELVQLPSGSRVHSNANSKKMLGGNTINVHVNGRVGASDAEIRDIANKVAKEINSRVNRVSTSSMGF